MNTFNQIGWAVWRSPDGKNYYNSFYFLNDINYFFLIEPLIQYLLNLSTYDVKSLIDLLTIKSGIIIVLFYFTCKLCTICYVYTHVIQKYY